MTDAERCEACGSYGEKCPNEEPVLTCRCARCAGAAADELLATLKLAQKWIGRCEWAGDGMAEMYRTIRMVEATLTRYGSKP